MSVPQIRIKVEDFRAVSNADIIIDGITIVAGENGSGKSTLSKLLYYLFKTACNYEVLVTGELNRNLRDIFRFVEIAISELHISNNKVLRNELRKELHDLYDIERFSEEQMERWSHLINSVKNSYVSIVDEKEKILSERPRRLLYIINDILERESGEKENKKIESLSSSFEKIDEILRSHFKKALGKVKSRPTSLFAEALSGVFSEGILPKHLEVLEYNEPIFSKDKSNLSIPFSIQNVIYTDTPMVIGMEDAEVEYWNDLNDLLRKRGKSISSDLSQIISKEVIKGEVSLDESPSGRDFIYKRTDGITYDLLDCATGIKSFAILQLLLKNGALNDKTLLIIDEPEVHLHPQWIVEYARMIVLLNKQLGVKFFIASHDPDFVGAIRYISEKQGNLDKVNYYFADKKGGNYVYDYMHLGIDIEPIFKSFNRAIERIDQYGA
ncbi:AAA family ATPase [Nemorincola caseinilytica]|uniref:AAA family ATPase n=1 Tax=Nemorincola caseinilytica TaxID=2054315 RepID=A0ABP8NL29_9BACT